MDLSGAKTIWASNGAPPLPSLTGLTSNISDIGLNDLKDMSYFEFIKVASTAILKFPYNSFPMSNATNSNTGYISTRTGHNTHGYAIPSDGKLLGFSVDFVSEGKGAVFYVLLGS